jgi:hypothetical protein
MVGSNGSKVGLNQKSIERLPGVKDLMGPEINEGAFVV